MFNRSRLTLARKRRGLTKIRLAELIGVTSKTISNYEGGSSEPPADALERIASVVRFPVEFFAGDDLEEPREESASFRALSRMSAAQLHMALSAGALAVELSRWIDQRFNLPPCDIPDLRELRPEAAAEALRASWRLGEQPIGNLVHLLEAKGIRIFSLGRDASDDVDAFSMWKAGTPFIFLSTSKSGERSRFDAAHELGHLVLHRHAAPSGRPAELEANAFASAFLMPRASVLARRPWPPTIDTLVSMKKTWDVSVLALAHRLHGVGLLSDWHYRDICIAMAPRRRNEPEGIARETSQLLAKVFGALREDGVARSTIARDLRIFPEDLDDLVYGLVMTGVQGGRPSDGPARAGRGSLRAL